MNKPLYLNYIVTPLLNPPIYRIWMYNRNHPSAFAFKSQVILQRYRGAHAHYIPALHTQECSKFADNCVSRFCEESTEDKRFQCSGSDLASTRSDKYVSMRDWVKEQIATSPRKSKWSDRQSSRVMWREVAAAWRPVKSKRAGVEEHVYIWLVSQLEHFSSSVRALDFIITQI